jgi:hypothetical protein
MEKKKKQKEKYATIKARVGSIVIVPKEIEAFKKHGIDLLVALKTIQKEIYKKPKHMNWTEVSPSFYTCETPLGKYIISEMMSIQGSIIQIKNNNNELIGYVNSFEEAKELVRRLLITKLNELTSFFGFNIFTEQDGLRNN